MKSIRTSRNLTRTIQNIRINNLRYAEDFELIAEDKEDLPRLLDIVEGEDRKKELGLSKTKTEPMVVTRTQGCPQEKKTQ